MLSASRISVLLVLFVVTGCTTYTGSADNPLARSFTWFSYVAGDDIKAACTSESRDHFRFVYNANYEQQIRAYDLKGVEGGADFVARARNESGNVARLSFSNPLGPWELDRSQTRLSNTQAAELITALDRDAAAAPPAAGQQLASNTYYWIVAGCSAGNFRVWAFDQGKVKLSELAFAKILRAHDQTGVAFRPAKPVEGFADNAFYIRINSDADGITGRL